MPAFRFQFDVDRLSVSITSLADSIVPTSTATMSSLRETSSGVWECDRYAVDDVAAAALADHMASALFAGVKTRTPAKKAVDAMALAKVLFEATRASAKESAERSNGPLGLLMMMAPTWDELQPESKQRQAAIAQKVVAAAMGG